jgi:hypothetical protein
VLGVKGRRSDDQRGVGVDLAEGLIEILEAGDGLTADSTRLLQGHRICIHEPHALDVGMATHDLRPVPTTDTDADLQDPNGHEASS